MDVLKGPLGDLVLLSSVNKKGKWIFHGRNREESRVHYLLLITSDWYSQAGLV